MSPEPSAHPPESSPAELPQQAAISPALRRRLQQCYEHGVKLAAQEKYDFDYAHTLFAECVVKDPGNLVYVEAFLDNLQRKYDNNKRGGRLQVFVGKGPFKKAVAGEDWAALLELGPELLKRNPWDAATLRAMARACEALHFYEVELRYLKNALDANPRDPDVNRHCAMSLARLGHFDQAIACWHRVEEARRHDPEPPQMISRLTIEKARGGVGLPAEQRQAAAARPKPATAAQPASTPSPEPSPPGESPEPTPKRREIPLSPRQKLEQALAQNPTDPDNYLGLAQLHLDDHRFADALRVLTRALAALGEDLKIRERLEEVTMLGARHQLAIAEKQLATEKSEQAVELVRQMRANLNHVELEIYEQRCRRYPADPQWKYELGLRLKRVGNYRQAVELLREVQSVPSLQLAVGVELGECFQQLKQFPQALQHYRQAVQAAATSDRPDPPEQALYKRALYRAGTLAAGLKEGEIASQYLHELVQLDPGYKDARARLDKIEQKRHNA